jgi:hypothetical protein
MVKEIYNATGELARVSAPFFSIVPDLFIAGGAPLVGDLERLHGRLGRLDVAVDAKQRVAEIGRVRAYVERHPSDTETIIAAALSCSVEEVKTALAEVRGERAV